MLAYIFIYLPFTFFFQIHINKYLMFRCLFIYLPVICFCLSEIIYLCTCLDFTFIYLFINFFYNQIPIYLIIFHTSALSP